MSRLRVAVLMGGASAERKVSLSTGRQVLQALDPEKYEAFPVDTGRIAGKPIGGGSAALPCASPGEEAPESPALAAAASDSLVRGDSADLAQLANRRPDVAVICLHGQYGEDGTIQGMLELLGIPYTGSGVLASALAMDKIMSKKFFELEGIPTPPSLTLRGRAEAEAYLRDLEAGTAALGCPAVVKPSHQGSTIGITIVHEADKMAAALDLALRYDSGVLVEKFVRGIELTGSVLGNEEPYCLPIVEIVPASGFYDYFSKYEPGATEEIVPARISEEQTRQAQELSVRAHQALGCRGFSRTDMLLADDGLWVLEVNTIPGMTPTSLLPRAADAAGIPFPRLLDRMIELALEGSDNSTGG